VTRHQLAQFLALATFVLLLAGGLVTSTDSGLAVPDWPLSFGGLFPPMVGGIRFEHTHRVVAATVGLLTLILTIWIGVKEMRAGVRRLAIACLGAVVLQGILGGLTVLYRLPTVISVAHACLGPIFFCLVVVLAEVTRPPATEKISGEEKDSSPLFRISLITTYLVFFQILLGAVVRHTGEGVGFHVSFAFLVLLLTGFLVTQTLNHFGDERALLRPSLFLGFLVLIELFLGIGAFIFTQVEGTRAGLGEVIFPTLHQALGSLLLATAVIVTLRSRVTLRAVVI